MELTRNNIEKANSRINQLKRVGYKVKPDTVVIKINDREITYRQFKRLRKRF